MNFDYNETQSMIAQSIKDFAEKNIKPFIMEWDEAQTFPIDLFKKLGEMGFMGVLVPEELGGRGIASALVKAAYDYALENGYKPVATCSYAVVWLKRHPEYNGKTGNDFGGEGTCAV